MIPTNLPSGYNGDSVKQRELYARFYQLEGMLYMTRFMLEKITFREYILKDEKYKFMFSVELVNQLVLNGMPFRDELIYA